MIEINLGTMLDNFSSLNVLANMKMSMVPARMTAKALIKANDEAKEFAVLEEKLLKDYDKDSDEYKKEIKQVREEMVVFPTEVKRLKLSKLKKANGADLDIEPIHLVKLDWLIEDDLED